MEFCTDVCFFGTAYKTKRLSVVDAFNKSTIRVDGIDSCWIQNGTIKTMPCGKLLCAHCNYFKHFDAFNRVFSVRNFYNGGELLIDGLICQECFVSEEIQNMEEVRFAELCHEDAGWELKLKAKECQKTRNAKKCVLKWRKFVQLRKERRRLVRDVSLVFARKVENCNPAPVLDAVVKQFNEMHCMCN
jgi:hypothetical protein